MDHIDGFSDSLLTGRMVGGESSEESKNEFEGRFGSHLFPLGCTSGEDVVQTTLEHETFYGQVFECSSVVPWVDV